MIKVWIRTDIGHKDEYAESTIEHAEQLHGERLDRRCHYLVFDGKVHRCWRYTCDCSGCEGGGCRECGYKGKRRNRMWLEVGT